MVTIAKRGSNRPIVARGYVRGLLILVLMGSLAACTTLPDKSTRPVVVEPLTILLQTDISGFRPATLGVFPLLPPPYAPDASRNVTDLYWGQLQRYGVFQRMTAIARFVRTSEEALWWGRQEGCDLVLRGEISYLMDGTGGMPTELRTSIEIIDVRSGKPLWNLRQTARSRPGADLNFVWITIPGGNAQRHLVLASFLAEQLAAYLSSSVPEPVEKRK